MTELAWPYCDYAYMLLERDENGDQQKATGMLGEATGTSTDLGMRSFHLDGTRVFQTRHPEGLNVSPFDPAFRARLAVFDASQHQLVAKMIYA